MPTTEKLQMAQKCGITITTAIKGGIETMCNYSDYVYDRGEAKGKAEGKVEGKTEAQWQGIQNIMKSLGVPFEKGAEVLALSEEELALVREYDTKRQKAAEENS